ncbi:hypothetical protein HYH03_015031 [Edaphochlamys debaryana]|uniref:G domain-containing protein n=1 Tax=Edaphochlamys debaryana TaxID=47281 RepID=A0A836BRP1_9CHLO|nr:hypothetical protein HYH03_015031 [Edaphochlamys debaryana]|eukprot:KAG2486327.1 hypothetical protein HYH03_015031 [Edaphochlamys debaryana]
MAARNVASWFPGHVAKALKQMEQNLKLVDLVVEVRDARLPLSSASSELQRLAAHKRRLVLLNKVDLAQPEATQAALSLLRAQGMQALPCEATREGSGTRLLDALLSAMPPPGGAAPRDLALVLVAGLPNTGKSSTINALKRAAGKRGLLEGEQAHTKTARAGPTPGVTRQMAGFKVCASPLVYLLDSPGVTPPALRDPGVARRLALAGLLPPGLVDEGELLGSLVQRLVSSERDRRELWAAADGHLPSSSSRRGGGGGGWGTSGSGHGPGGGPGGFAEARERQRRARSLGLARALYEVVSLPAPPPREWYPGIEDEMEMERDGPGGPVRSNTGAGAGPGPGSAGLGLSPAAGGSGSRGRGDQYARDSQPLKRDGGNWETSGQAGAGASKAAGAAAAAAAAAAQAEAEAQREAAAAVDAQLRADALVRALTRGAAVDAGRRAAAQRAVLEAFRSGALGRYTLDDVGG